jgi:precorrin-6B methylase 2
MRRRGNCWDNAPMESPWGMLRCTRWSECDLQAPSARRLHRKSWFPPHQHLEGFAMKFSIFRKYSLAVLLLASSAVMAQPTAFAERYTPVPASADGIGKRYMGREISAVMGWQGAAWLEREEREREERTDLLLAALALQPGMVVADIGAGTGYLSRRMAPAVMPGGKVWAVDVQPEMISLLEAGAKRSGLTQIEARLGAVDDIRLPAASVDMAIMVDVYHELSQPYEVMTSVMKALKPGGRIVFVEYKAEDPRVPIKPLHKMTEVQIKREAAVFALDWERTVNTLPWQHVVVFRKRG